MVDVKSVNKFDLDSILKEIGQLGKYQIIVIFLVTFPAIFSAFNSQDYIFTASKITHRCLIPECDTEDANITTPWLSNAVPNNDQCNRYTSSNISLEIQNVTSETCPASLFNRNETTACDGYVYDRTNSVVYDFGLECQEWKRVLIGTFTSLGTLLVLPITGYISDKWGRRVALTLNAVNCAILGLVKHFSVNYEMFLVLSLMSTTLGGGALSSAYVIATELVGPEWRTLAGCTMNGLFALGEVILGFIAWGVPEWKTLLLVLYIPQLLMISYYWILSESVRWLLSKGQYAEAEKIIKKAAKTNGKVLSAGSLESLSALKDGIKAEEMNSSEKNSRGQSLFIKVIKSPIMLKRMCIIPFWWMSMIFVYYGMSINSVSLVGNMYLNYVLVTAIEIPGFYTSVLVADRIGRRKTLMYGFATCAICSYIFAFMPKSQVYLSLFLYLFGKYSISAVLSTVYIYTSELIPTQHRHSLLGFSSMIGRVGSIVAPLSPTLMIWWSGLPSAIFGTFALVSGILVVNMPETLNTKFPDTIEEAETVGKSVK